MAKIGWYVQYGDHASIPNDPDDPDPNLRPYPDALFACETHGRVHQYDGSTWVDWFTPPNGELAYAEFTSSVNATATTEATANTVVTAGAVSVDGSTEIEVEFYAPFGRPDQNSGRTMSLYLYDGSSSIGRVGVISSQAASAAYNVLFLRRRLTPTSGSHTYSIRAAVSAGTGLIAAGAGGSGADVPGFIRVRKR